MYCFTCLSGYNKKSSPKTAFLAILNFGKNQVRAGKSVKTQVWSTCNSSATELPKEDKLSINIDTKPTILSIIVLENSWISDSESSVLDWSAAYVVFASESNVYFFTSPWTECNFCCCGACRCIYALLGRPIAMALPPKKSKVIDKIVISFLMCFSVYALGNFAERWILLQILCIN